MSEAVYLKLIDAGGAVVVTFLFVGLLRATGLQLVRYLDEYVSVQREMSTQMMVGIRELTKSIAEGGIMLVNVYREGTANDSRIEAMRQTKQGDRRIAKPDDPG